MYWMITNRKVESTGFGDDFDVLTYWRNDSGNLQTFADWTKLSDVEFRQGLVQVADAFPDLEGTSPEDQKHVNIFVHGFDISWSSAAQRYGQIVQNLFSGPNSLGECILFTWPSKGNLAGYFPDRSEARRSAEDFADVLSALYD